jgi:hypothetical protein
VSFRPPTGRIGHSVKGTEYLAYADPEGQDPEGQDHESPDHESPAETRKLPVPETPCPGNSPVATTTRPILYEYNHVVIFDKFFNPVVDAVWTTTASKTVTPQCGYGGQREELRGEPGI